MKFHEAYNAEYYSERITNKSKKHMMKYMKFLRKGSLKMLDIGCGRGYYVETHWRKVSMHTVLIFPHMHYKMH